MAAEEQSDKKKSNTEVRMKQRCGIELLCAERILQEFTKNARTYSYVTLFGNSYVTFH